MKTQSLWLLPLDYVFVSKRITIVTFMAAVHTTFASASTFSSLETLLALFLYESSGAAL